MFSAGSHEKTPLIAIGGSTGAPTALSTILKAIPADFPGTIIIAQHLDEVFAPGLVEVLDKVCAIPVVGAAEGQRLEPAKVFVSQSNDHMIVDGLDCIRYRVEPASQHYRPSVDELFASLGLSWQGPLAAVLLSGMGNDGAQGLLALRRLGHYTIAQEQHSCAVYGMPKAAKKLNAAVELLPPNQIVAHLLEWLTTLKTG